MMRWQVGHNIPMLNARQGKTSPAHRVMGIPTWAAEAGASCSDGESWSGLQGTSTEPAPCQQTRPKQEHPQQNRQSMWKRRQPKPEPHNTTTVWRGLPPTTSWSPAPHQDKPKMNRPPKRDATRTPKRLGDEQQAIHKYQMTQHTCSVE